MSIRDWSKRRLLVVWAVGITLESALFVIPAIQRQRQMARLQREQEQLLKNSRPLSHARRDSILQQLRDSTGVNIVMRGDSILDVTLSTEAQRKLDSAGPAIQSVFMKIAVAALVLAAMIYLPIPLVLLGITRVWLREHRRVGPDIPAHVA